MLTLLSSIDTTLTLQPSVDICKNVHIFVSGRKNLHFEPILSHPLKVENRLKLGKNCKLSDSVFKPLCIDRHYRMDF